MPYRIRQLDRSDCASVVDLHHLILASNPRAEILRADAPEHFRANIEGIGITFGAFEDETLIAYAALAFGGPAASLIVPHVRGVSLDVTTTAVHDGSGVHPAHRGHDLQDRLNEHRLEAAAARGFVHSVGSVSVLNPYSLQNHFDFGFVVRGFARLYGGLERAILHRGPTVLAAGAIEEEVLFKDLGMCSGVPDGTYSGVSLRWDGSSCWLRLQRA